MRKWISYALFGDCNSFEFPFYLRGVYFNARMNKLLYPSWKMVVHCSPAVTSAYEGYLQLISHLYDVRILEISYRPDDQLYDTNTRNMLWRMKPIWSDADVVICRDLDSVTTDRERVIVESWLNYDGLMMGIQDNPAHTIPLMGGMCGFHVEMFKKYFPEWASWENMVDGFKFNRHGGDQDFLTQKIYKKIPNAVQVVSPHGSDHKNKYWESDLTCRHVGSAGVVDFELLRFFKRFDPKGESINKEFERLLHHERKHLYWL